MLTLLMLDKHTATSITASQFPSQIKRSVKSTRPRCFCMCCSWNVLSAFLQCSVGHWDWSADNYICWPHWWCHESFSGARHQAVCLWSLRCLCQALGHQRRNVPTDLYWPRVGHQCYLRKATHAHALSCMLSSNCRDLRSFTAHQVLSQVLLK